MVNHHINKLAIITGASRGIGEATAYKLASQGANLLLNHSSASSAAETNTVKANIGKDFPNSHVEVLEANLGSPDGSESRRLVEFAKEKFTGPDGHFQIDIIINNAGISINQYIPELTVENFECHYRVNVLGPLILIQAAQPYLPKDRSGRIVNVSSISSSMGQPGQSIYGGSKAALEAMTRTWARELAENCIVNAINPGPVDTRMYRSTSPAFEEIMRPMIEHTPLAQLSEAEKQHMSEEEVEAIKKAGGRMAKPQEIAGIISMLCSPEAGWCTGNVICANGGMIMLQ